MRVWFIFNWLRGDDNKLYEIELGKKSERYFAFKQPRNQSSPFYARQTYTHQLTTMSMTIVAGVMWQSTLI